MITKETALLKVQELVKRFNEQLPAYKKSEYNETQTRRDFLDPFFKALGWDIDNEQGFAESYREVIHEDRVKVGKATKAPDYSFRIGGIRKFFVEAKKPSVLIKDDIQPAYQVRRYGWSAKLNVSIITDFEEFAIYDCNKKPNPADKTSTSRIKYITFNEYVKEWDFLWNTFSKEAVNKGFFDTFVKGTANKKGTDTVDKEFLKSLDDWRTLLAETISKENKELDEDELNFVVQQTLDRIIFIRICEDRSIEPYGSLQDCLKIGDYYKNLLQLFKQADDKYNSGLFDFKKDTISHKISINNKTLKTIITQLYYPESPYEFSVLSVEILGSAYEQFLGKTITINNRGKAIIELKPEVRKAGGVYYTPQYIVDYIVANTIGRQLENKTPKEATEIKICDPACGSGSFLLGAYQYLLNWHKDYYIQNPNKKNPLTPDGNLTTGEKKNILLNNIYGVDIDTNAVEVTKLSLLLKCMEGETQASISHQVKMFNERVLPTLENNIKSGNSLIDMDYYDSKLDFGEERKIKPFSWQKGFPEVFKNGGFDVVIGNPPYVSAKSLTELFKSEREYLTNSPQYKTLFQKWDLYIPFVEKGIQLLKRKGLTSMIIPYPFLNQIYGQLIRKEIIANHKLIEIVDLSDVKVFKDAVVTNTIYLVEKLGKTDKINITHIANKSSETISKKCTLPIKDFVKDDDKNIVWNTSQNKDIKFESDNFNTLGDICFISKGMVLNADEIKAKGKFIKKDLINDIETTIHIKKYVEAKNIDKFSINKTLYLEWDTERVPSKLSRPTFIELYENPKILINKLGVLKSTFDSNHIFCDQTIRVAILWHNLKSVQNNSINNSVTRYLSKSRNELEQISNEYNELFIVGILNSKIGIYLLDSIRGKNNIDINPEYLKNIPIPKIDKNSKIKHDQVVSIVNQLITLHIELKTANLESKKEQIKNKIEYSEDKINDLVYKLYDLTNEEVKIIES
jgi:type I restriction-modification system DNA methylase subunit